MKEESIQCRCYTAETQTDERESMYSRLDCCSHWGTSSKEFLFSLKSI